MGISEGTIKKKLNNLMIFVLICLVTGAYILIYKPSESHYYIGFLALVGVGILYSVISTLLKEEKAIIAITPPPKEHPTKQDLNSEHS